MPSVGGGPGPRDPVRRDAAAATPQLADGDVAGTFQCPHLLGQVGVADVEVVAQEGEVRRRRVAQQRHDRESLRRVDDRIEVGQTGRGDGHARRSRVFWAARA